MPRDPQVSLTREGAVGALKLVMIVLAASIFWNAGSALNQELQKRSLITASPFLRSASRLLVGTETTAPFQDRVMDFWVANHRLVALLAMLVATLFLITRYLAMGRIIDYLYLESDARDRRIYSGFVANIIMAMLHAGGIYGLVVVSEPVHAALVPSALLLMLIINMLWLGSVLLASKQVERKPLRGVKYLILTSGCAAILLFGWTWAMEDVRPTGDLVKGSEMILMAAGVAVTLCIVDACVQSYTYFPRRRAQHAAAA